MHSQSSETTARVLVVNYNTVESSVQTRSRSELLSLLCKARNPELGQSILWRTLFFVLRCCFLKINGVSGPLS